LILMNVFKSRPRRMQMKKWGSEVPKIWSIIRDSDEIQRKLAVHLNNECHVIHIFLNEKIKDFYL
jgi:hypothetical protein